MKRFWSVLLCICMLFFLFAVPASALDFSNISQTSPDYRERYSTEKFDETEGRMFVYSSESVMFSIRGSGASFTFSPVMPTGQTSCNAYRFVLINYTASDKMIVNYRYRDSEEEYTAECAMEQSGDRQTCLVYMKDADRVDSVTVSFFGVRSGLVQIFSINPVSAYRPTETEYGTFTSCTANLSEASVTLTGRVLSGVTARYSDAKLLVYRLPLGANLEDYLMNDDREVLAESKVSSRFTFTVPAETATERLSRYAVTILTKDGEELTLTAPTYVNSFGMAENPPASGSSDTHYKGVIGSGTSTVISLGAKSTVIDVYLDRLLSAENATYSYTSGGVTIQVNRSAVASLDSHIRAYTAAGCTVYLRLLVSPDAVDFVLAAPGSTDASYKGICLLGDQSAAVFYTLTDYLADRYGKDSSGRIGGMIVGSGVDSARTENDCGMMSLDAYVRNLAQIILTARMAILQNGGGIRLIVPVTDEISPQLIGTAERDGNYDKQLLLTGLSTALSESGYKDYMVLLESRNIPFSLTVGESGVAVSGTSTGEHYTAANVGDFRRLLASCGMSDMDYLFDWTPSPELSDAELLVFYLYSYHALARTDGPKTFFLHADTDQLHRLSYVVGRVDTGRGSGQDEFVLGVLGASSWHQLLGDAPVAEETTVLNLNGGVTCDNAVGVYECWDFSSALGTLNWSADPNITSFGITTTAFAGRALFCAADLSADTTAGIYYSFSYPENMSIYDALSLRFYVGDTDSVRSVFELRVTLFGDGYRAEGTVLTSGGEEVEYSLDTSELPGPVRSVRVTVRAVSGSDASCNLYFKNISACSETFNDMELQKLIENHRKEMRKDAEGSRGLNTVGVTSLLILAVATVLVTLLLVRQTKHRKN